MADHQSRREHSVLRLLTTSLKVTHKRWYLWGHLFRWTESRRRGGHEASYQTWILFQMDKDLAVIFSNCLPNTLDTTVRYSAVLDPTKQEEEDTFIVTGDIDAMWLRDSTNQVRIPYHTHSCIFVLADGCGFSFFSYTCLSQFIHFWAYSHLINTYLYRCGHIYNLPKKMGNYSVCL